VQCCNIYYSFTQFQDGFNYEQARLEEDAVMQQKYKVLSFAIVAALYIFLVPSTSQAEFKVTHTPGETVGPQSRPAISCGNNCTQQGCQTKLVEAHLRGARERKEISESEWQQRRRTGGSVGLGSVTRYIQATGGYCYYYKGGTSSGNSGPNTWRYDPCSMKWNGSAFQC
jgi:hypothetical protein